MMGAEWGMTLGAGSEGKRMALDSGAKRWLIERFGKDVRFDEPMAKHTSFQVGGPADAYVRPVNIEKLIMLMEWTKNKAIPYLVVGGGTNLLVQDNGIRGVVVALTRCLREIVCSVTETNRVLVTAMAGANLQALCRFALQNGLAGMNFALGIPGTVGGGIVMNAGTPAGAIGDVLDRVKVLMPTGEIKTFGREDLDIGYRRLTWPDGDMDRGRKIILEGRFRLRPADGELLQKEAAAILQNRKTKQPWGLPSAGSFFKNPASGKSAGELIDLAGLKGQQIGDAAVSSKHANFIVNTGNASAADIIALMQYVQKTVFGKFNVHLEPEVKIVGT
jgi:UDP-N-acetylmuramate dehydrogenase